MSECLDHSVIIGSVKVLRCMHIEPYSLSIYKISNKQVITLSERLPNGFLDPIDLVIYDGSALMWQKWEGKLRSLASGSNQL